MFFTWGFCSISSNINASCLSPIGDFWWEKSWKIWYFFHFKIKSPNVKHSLQNYKVSKCKLLHKNSCQLWYWNGILRISLAEWSCMFDIFAANQNQGGKFMHFQPAHFPFGTQKWVFYRGQFVIWLGVLIIMFNLIIWQCINLFKVERKHQSISETSTF